MGFDSRVLDLKRGDQFAPDYLKLNLNAVVPTLMDDDHVVLQSNTIMQHLCVLNPQHPLSSATADNAAACSVWFKRADHFHTAIHAITYVCVNRAKLLALPPEQLEKRFRNIPDPVRSIKLRQIVEDGFDSAPVSAALETLGEILPQLEAATQAHEWLAGDHATLADLAIFPFVHRLDLLGFEQLWGEGDLARWHKAMMQRPSFQIAVGAVVPASALENFAAAGQIAWPQIRVRLQ